MREIQETPVIIIGGGPTGLSLALGLGKYGIKSILLEKNAEISEHSKAPVIHQRTREIFDQWGIGNKFLAAGNLISQLEVKTSNNEKTLFTLDFNLLQEEAHNPGMLILKQSETEKILLETVSESGLCDLRFSTTAISLKEKEDIVLVKALNNDGEYYLSAKYVIGCDGASGSVREALKLPFPGKTYPVRTVLADVSISDKRNEQTWPRFYNGKGEITVAIKITQNIWRLIHLETGQDPQKNDEEIKDEEIGRWVQDTLGDGSFKKVWASPFKIHRRSSPRFKVGKVFLAGDAAHIHSPVGGQGMNAGIQDAHNLAWKLAAVINGGNAWRLLDSYETERKEAVVDKVSGYTDLITRSFLQAPLPVRISSFFILRKILSLPVLREKFLRRTTMINLGYSNSEITDPGVRSAGMRLPNVQLFTPDSEKIRIYDLMPLGPFLLQIGNAEIKNRLLDHIPSISIGPLNYIDLSEKLKKLLGKSKGFILVRPDMHIAWTGTSVIKLIHAVNKISGIKNDN